MSAEWPTLTLGQLTERTRPICYGVLKPGPFIEGGVPLLRIVDIKENRVDESGVHRISSQLDDEFARSRLSGGEVLLSIQGTIGRVAICPPSMAGANISRTIAVIEPDERLDKSFLRYFLMHLAASSRFEVTGTTRDSLNISTIRDIEVPLPPLDEQRRIVAILEDHLSRIDASIHSLSQSTRKVESLQRRALVNLLIEDGEEVGLVDVLTQSIGGLWGEGAGEADLDVRVIRVTEMGRLGTLNPVTAATRSITQAQYTSRALREGDLLLEKSGGGPATPVGRVGLVLDLEDPAICSNFMQLMRPDFQRVHPRWLHLYLNAYHLSGRTSPMQKASTNIRNIKASDYLKILIKVPTLERQSQLITLTEEWLDSADRLAETLTTSLRHASTLRRSLLSTAFAGQLTKEPSLV